MRLIQVMCLVFVAILCAWESDAQVIDESFDIYATSSPPPGYWWNWGTSGTNLVDDTVFRGVSGKSVEFERIVFDGSPYAIGQSFSPVFGPDSVELTYYFRVTAADHEMLSAFGHESATNQVAWWVTVGGWIGSAVGTYSNSQGWTYVMSVLADTWYGVNIVADVGAHSYDITVWEDGNPTNTATVTGLDFRDGAGVDAIDEIQFGDFNGGSTTYSDSAFIDDVLFVGPVVFLDGFESGNTDAWSSVIP